MTGTPQCVNNIGPSIRDHILRQLSDSDRILHPDNREVKHDGKRQTAKMKLLPSVFSSLYSRIKIFVFAVNSKRHFSISV